MTERANPDEPIHILLLRLARSLIVFAALCVLPFVIPLFLPLPLVVAYWILAMLGAWVENRRHGRVDATYLWMLGASFGLSWAVAKRVPGTLPGLAAGIACFCILIWLQSLWQKVAGLRIEAGLRFDDAASGPLCKEAEPAPVTGTSAGAWGAPPPVTPEGETLRLLSCSEFAMGGPVICDYLFPDGSVISGVGASTGFSPDGRYFVSPIPSRQSWGLLIFDRRDRLLYRCHAVSRFWEIDLVADGVVRGRNGGPGTTTYAARIDDLIAHSSKEGMVAVADLWIPEADWNRRRREQERNAPFPAPPAGGPGVVLLPHLPASLMALEAPLDPLVRPKAELVVAGVASGLLLSLDHLQAVWRDDGRALACEAEAKDGGKGPGYWHWTFEGGWRSLPKGRDRHRDLPPATREALRGVDAAWLMVDWRLLQPRLSQGGFGQLSGHRHSPEEIAGRMYPAPIIRQLLSLAGDGRDEERLESAPLRHGLRIAWRFLRRDEELGRDIHACAFDGRALDGEWLLDHRISADGRFAALIAHAPPPRIPHRIAILDAKAGGITWLGEEFYDPHCQAFGEDGLHVVHLVGRSDEDATHAADEPLPPPDAMRAFLRRRPGSRLQYRRSTVTLRDGQWQVEAERRQDPTGGRYPTEAR